MAKALTAQQVAERWSQRGSNSGETVRAGVASVQENPAEKAAAAKDRWLAGVQRAAQNGKYEAKLRQVTLADWKNAMINKGIPNMQNGYTVAKAKFARFMEQWLPYVRQGAAQIRMMPKNNLDQSIARAVAMIRHNAAFRANGAGMIGGAAGAIIGGLG